tara:strand:+ start:7599 stop:8297 length:699 start_codon:yes stop_codon:yes gene_type:complete
MTTQQITHHINFQASNVNFSEMKKNKMGGKVVYLSNEGRKKLLVQFPKLRAPFGMSEFVDQNTGRSSYSVDVSLDGNDDLQTRFRALDAEIVKLIAKNSKAWLGKVHTETVIKDVLYKPIVKEPSDPKYSPTLKFKILTNDKNEFIPEAYNNKRQEVKISSLEKGQSLKAIAHLSQIWIIDNKCGVTMRLEQAFLAPTEKLKGFAFQDDDEDMGEGAAEEEEEEEEETEYDE